MDYDPQTIQPEAQLEELAGPELEAQPLDRPKNRSKLVISGALVAAAVGAVAFAFGAVAGTPAGNAANANGIPLVSTPSASSGTVKGVPGWAGGLGGMWMGPGGRMGRGFGVMGQITITAIRGTQLSLKTADGWTRTIDASGATVTSGGQTVALSTLKVGDQIVFSESRQSDGTFKITAIQVVLPEAGGTVTAVGSDSVTVKQADGTSKTITLTGSTTYRLAGQASTKSAISVGLVIEAQGTVSGSTFTASTVEIQPSVVFGTVTAKTSSTITVKQQDGSTATIKVTSSTTYRVKGVASASIANVAVGDTVVAQGTHNSDGSLTATVVASGAVMERGGGPGMMHGFPGFPGLPGTSSSSGTPNVSIPGA